MHIGVQRLCMVDRVLSSRYQISQTHRAEVDCSSYTKQMPTFIS